MDHLFWPAGHHLPRPRVPYLCAEKEETLCNDITLFPTWAELMRWNLDPTLDFIESATRFQAWFQFGLLRFLVEATDKPFNLEEFVVEHDGRSYVNSTRIQEVVVLSGIAIPGVNDRLYSGYYRSSRFDSSSDVEMFQTFWSSLERTMRTCSDWIVQVLEHQENRTPSTNPWTNEIFNVFWSTLILWEQITDPREDLHPSKSKRRPEVDTIFGSIPSLPQIIGCISEGLKLVGRCPSVIKRTNLSSLEAFRLYSTPVSTGVNHDQCSHQACTCFDIKESTYQKRHVLTCNQRCVVSRIDFAFLCELLDRDAIPIVQSTRGPDGRVMVEIIDAANVASFTAISHVWAGGLGNFEENAHYQCQLELLHADLASRPSRLRPKADQVVHYWLDSLCIPAKGDLKTKAIGTMAYIYAKAAFVHVIDPEMSILVLKDLPKPSIGLTLLCSPWMARSWTLQEGALAVNLRLKFADCVIPFTQIEHYRDLMKRTTIQGLWTRDVDCIGAESLAQQKRNWGRAMGWTDVEGDDFVSLEPHERFITIWNELGKRSSMMTDDLALILAALLDQSASEVAKLHVTQRMHALLQTQSSLPLSLLFQTLDHRSVSWRPAFPTCQRESSLLADGFGFMTFTAENALEVTSMDQVRILQCSKSIPTQGNVIIEDSEKDLLYEITFDAGLPNETPQFLRDVILLLPDHDHRNVDVNIQRGVCFVWSQNVEAKWQWKLIKPFTWNLCPSVEVVSNDTCLLDQDGMAKTLRLSRLEAKVPAAVPFFLSEISADNSIRIDIGAGDVTRLSWSRPDFYPFTETSLRMAQALNLMLPISILGQAYLAGQCGARAWLAFHLDQGLIVCMLYAIGWFVSKSVRGRLAQFEHRTWRNYINFELQDIWAKSFCSTTTEKTYPSRRQLKGIVLVAGLMYASLFLASTCTTIILFIRFRHRAPRDMDRTFGLLDAFLLTYTETGFLANFAKILAICTFFDLVARLAAVIFFDPFELWRKRKVHAQRKGAKARYAWLVISLRALFPIMLGTFWIFFVQSFIWLRRHTTDEKYRFGIFPFVMTNILLAAAAMVALRYLYGIRLLGIAQYFRRGQLKQRLKRFKEAKIWWTRASEGSIRL